MKILIVGDSYTFGDGCASPADCWASLLQKNYPTLTVVNRAVPGNDNMSMFSELVTVCQTTSVDLIVFAGSFSSRRQIQHPVDSEETTPWVPGHFRHREHPEYVKAAEYYLKYLSNDKVSVNLTVSSILGAYGQSIVSNAKFIWSRPEKDIPTTLLDSIQEYQIPTIQDFDYSGIDDIAYNYKNFVSPDLHINSAGHQIYFEQVIVPKLKQIEIIH